MSHLTKSAGLLKCKTLRLKEAQIIFRGICSFERLTFARVMIHSGTSGDQRMPSCFASFIHEKTANHIQERDCLNQKTSKWEKLTFDAWIRTRDLQAERR